MRADFFSRLLEFRDAYTKGRTERGVSYALAIGREIGLTQEELDHLQTGGLIHDVGKVAIPDIILLKPAKLTAEEYEVMKLHVQYGYELVKDLGFPKEALDVLLYHQEKFDGSGYPFGKKGQDIPLLARIYTIADSFEAMTSRRIYKKSKPWKMALAELEELAGSHFDPDIVPYAVKVFEKIKPKEHILPEVDTELEKIRWSFYYVDFSGAIKGDLFLPTLNAFIEKGDPFCLTFFDVENLFEINQKFGWDKGNEVLKTLVNSINLQCCAMHDIRDLVIKLMRQDVIDITSPVIFRIGGDEFAVIAPYIPPPEKVEGVIKAMREKGVSIKALPMRFPESFKSSQEVLNVLVSFTKGVSIHLE